MRVGPPARPARRLGFWARYALWAVGILLVTFGIGYLFATRVMFPPQEVLAAGIVVPSVAGSLPHPDRAPGIIIAQAPLPGQQLRAGASVDVGVSAGRARTPVPDVIGLPEQIAMSLLQQLGFSVDLQRREARALPGNVIATEPAPGTEIFLPARVAVLISAGPAKPDSIPAGGDSTAVQQ